MSHRVISPWTWQEQIGFSHGCETVAGARVLYCAGQISVDADGAPLHFGDMRVQVLQALDNVETVLREAGYTLAGVARLATPELLVELEATAGRA